MADTLDGMTSLEDPGPDRVSHKEMAWRVIVWTVLTPNDPWLGVLVLLDHCLDVHGDDPHHTGGREDSVRCLGWSPHRVEMGKSVSLHVTAN